MNDEPIVDDVYEQTVDAIKQEQHAFDLERVQRPDFYGPVPKSVWRRLRHWQQRTGRGER